MLGAFIILLLSSLPQNLCSTDEATFRLAYNGGKIMTEPVMVSLLWFGDGWEESGKEVLRIAITSLTSTRYPRGDSDVPTLGNWWNIVQQYRDSSDIPVTDSVSVGAECSYAGTHRNLTLDQVIQIGQSVFNSTSIGEFGGMLSCTQVFKVDKNTIYIVMFSENILFAQGEMELKSLCSGNLEVGSNGVKVKMVWSRVPMNDDDQCSTMFDGEYYLGPPNKDQKIDSLVGYTLAKIADEVTNRDGTGWSSGDGSGDGSGLGVGTICDHLLERRGGAPLYKDMQRNISFNVVGLQGYRYIVQHIWDQQIRNCALILSESCAPNAVILGQPNGYITSGITVNHTAGLQPYPPNQKCRWKIQFPSAKFINFTFNYLSITTYSDDHLKICNADSSSARCNAIQLSNENTDLNLQVTGSSAYIEFISGENVSTGSRGWELSYSAGLCNGKTDIYDRKGIISYTTPLGFSYIKGLSCQWILHGKEGTPVSLSFTHINTSKNLDYLTIFTLDRKEKTRATQVSNFSGFFSESALPHINLTGEVMVVFATKTNIGTGWSANFGITSPNIRKRSPLRIIIIVAAVILTSIFLGFLTTIILRHWRKRTGRNPNKKLKPISLKNNKQYYRIGDGSSATVYKAILADESTVAVKSRRDTTMDEGLEEEVLCKTSNHPNIIHLVGYVKVGTGRKNLVFEFMSRGNLSWNLRERGEMLSWEKRLTITLQVSSALQFLHMNMEPPISHGNLRSENVLLDESYNAKLAGFGLANYFMNDTLDLDKTSEMEEDVCSFGLLLIELLKGKTTMHSYPCSTEYLNEVSELVKVPEHLDPCLEIPQNECKMMGLVKLADIAKWCITSRNRLNETSPKILDIVQGLKQVKQLFQTI